MANQNNESANNLALVIAAGVLLMLTLGGIVIVAGAVMTLLAFIAQFHTIRIGDATVTAADGRVFVFGGVVAGLVVALAVPSLAHTMDTEPGNYMPHFWLALGYSVGGIGASAVWEVLRPKEETAPPAETPTPPQPEVSPALPRPTRAPQFADWDDEHIDPYR